MFTFVLVAKLQGTGCGYTNTEHGEEWLFCNRITVFTRGNLERADTVDSESTYLGFPLIKLIKLMVFDINHHILHIFIFDIYHIFEHSVFVSFWCWEMCHCWEISQSRSPRSHTGFVFMCQLTERSHLKSGASGNNVHFVCSYLQSNGL